MSLGSHVSKVYRDEQNPWVKGSVCLFIEFALPPFSPPLPSVVEISKQNRHGTVDAMIKFTPVVLWDLYDLLFSFKIQVSP